MPARPVSIEVSEDPSFATKATLSFTYAGTALTAFKIDGATVPSGPDVDVMLSGFVAVLEEFEEDDADGSGDPVERELVCSGGGPAVRRAADGSTLTVLGTSPVLAPIPIARAYAIGDELLFLGY